MNRYRDSFQPIWEPFCGGLNTAAHHGGLVHCSDIRGDLIGLYKAIAEGWDPPTEVSQETYELSLKGDVEDPLRSFALYSCSHLGKCGSGYNPGRPRVTKTRPRAGELIVPQPASAARTSLLRDIPKIASFECLDFLELEPKPTEYLIYCDPPYKGVTGYGFSFDHEAFYERCLQWSEYTTVLVSEYDLPIGRCVSELERASNIHNKTRPRRTTEKIYLIGDGIVSRRPWELV